MAEIHEEIKELETQIANLPIGYISRKIINKKERFYQQWTENGKVKSKYIGNENVEDLKNKIVLRKELQLKLNELKTSASLVKSTPIREELFESKIVSEDELSMFISTAKDYQKRVLTYGIFGAIILRFIFIVVGLSMLNRFHWLLYIFSFILICSGLKIFIEPDESKDCSDSKLLKVLKKILPVTS
ncbi:MAG: hypothetical protein HUK24_07710, partial [Sphaerochaetaceae bacterium]|nr:hypothetical protein [Sphaerochaetaceae bacterium]